MVRGPLQLLFTVFCFLLSNIAFNETVINSFSLLHLCVCFFQEFSKVLTSRLLGILFCVRVVLPNGGINIHPGILLATVGSFIFRLALCVCVFLVSMSVASVKELEVSEK